MKRPLAVCAVLVLGAVGAAGCATAPDSPASSASRYPLKSGSTISISTTTEGMSEVRVTIPPGSPGAGEHTCTAPSLVEAAREAKNRLNEPGVSTVIEVDGKGHLISIEQTQTK